MKVIYRLFRWAAVIAAITLISSSPRAFAEDEAQSKAWETIGGDHLAGWTGPVMKDGVAELPPDVVAHFRYPQGPKGWYSHGFRIEHDGSRDWRAYFGLQVEVNVAAGHPVALKCDLLTPPPSVRQEYLPRLSSETLVQSPSDNGWQWLNIPWSSFGLDESQRATLEFIQEVRLSCSAELQIRNIRLTRAFGLALESPVRGRALPAGGEAHYDVTVFNCGLSAKNVHLGLSSSPWQSMPASVVPSDLLIEPGASASCSVTVKVPSTGIPPGGHESQSLTANASDVPPATLELVTAREIDGPSILHTDAEWAAIRDNVKHYDWARGDQADILRDADKWIVPQAARPPDNFSNAEKHVYTFLNADFPQVQTAAVAWQLTRDKRYAEKVAEFLRRLSDEQFGYPSTFAGTNMGSPQEGENFQRVAIAYDAIRDAEVLTEVDRAQIEHTFRLFMQTYETDLTVGNVGNWSTAANTACLFCALALGDLAAADRYIYGPCGFTDYLSKGVMDDGWWWECSSSYNFWVASELTQSALACRPWGIDLLNLSVPASYSSHTIVTPWALDPPYGISFEKWGPNHRSIRSIKQLWDAVPAAADYRGVTFGLNDGHGERVGGSRLELAYYAFRDPAYATFIKLANKRDLLYGIPELPDDPAKPYTKSGYAENIGYALLRSQTANRPIREQIQAVMKIGTQGGFHGHFDRVSLDNITRYGRSFWHPESIWWGYPNFMYKFYVQTSINHNMVVVDQKQQEAVPSLQPLFFSGSMMQVAVQETNARWSDPPYGGMRYQPGDTLESQMRKNLQSFPIVPDRQYGDCGPYTDRVLQRRAAVVTDDYVVLADYLKSSDTHEFDNLLQMKGLTDLSAGNKTLLRHDAQWNPDPRRAAQFVTDCNWYSATAPALARFIMHFGEGSDDADTIADLNEPGILHVDVHSLWPLQQQLMLANPAEDSGASQWVKYQVAGDDKPLVQRESGIWIIGSANVDVPVDGVKQLALSVFATEGKKKTLFWNSPRFEMAGGKEVPMTTVTGTTNVDAPSVAGQDYYNGPITIDGNPAINPLATQPANGKAAAILHIAVPDGAVRFKATLGGDYPLGDHSRGRKLFASRIKGTEAHFITILEPYEANPMIKSASAAGPGDLHVELADGRVQDISISHLDGNDADISVNIRESKGGTFLRSETTKH